jgi:hypothetical protein
MVSPFYEKILVCGLLSMVLIVVIVLSTSNPSRAEASTAYLVSTRDHFDKFGNMLISDRPYEPFDFGDLGCPQESCYL